jgi:hypothetical protein
MTMSTVNIYVLPSEPNTPPRAVVYDPDTITIADGRAHAHGAMATWSADIGTWAVAGIPVDNDLAEVITTHARSLGVDV